MTPAPGISPDDLPPALRDLHEAARFVVMDHAGAQVHWRMWGDRGPVIVLVHGGFGSWLHWAGNIRALSARHRLLVCDIPGYGGTPVPPGTTSMTDIATPIAATLRRMIGDTPHLICGFSFGAMLSGFIAPQTGAEGVVLLGAPNCGPGPAHLPGMQSWRALPPAERPAAHANNLRVLMLHGTDALDDTAIRIQTLCAESAIGKYRDLARADLADAALGGCTCWIHAVWGAEDALVRDNLGDRRRFIAGLGPQAAIEIWPALGHWLPWEDPGRVNALLSTLAARAEAAARARIG